MTFLSFFKQNSLEGSFSFFQSRMKKIVLLCGGMVFLYGFLSSTFHFVMTATPSLPYRFFIMKHRSHPSLEVPFKQRYVFFYHPGVHTNVIKQVKGLPGSVLSYDQKGCLWVDDFCVGRPLESTRTGKSLKKIQAGLIPPGFVFVYAPHEQSFDSRYEDFGLIPITSLQSVGVALL